ncbi:MAG: TetR/AcrR family transcriptional regulator [Woeseiaceae bacterium]|nr:TetR/AcrR family transcriptional regulator [Woeseiaceae bacterium]
MAQALGKRPVGRPREFDEDKALEAAMEAFWQKGYEATSLSDLCNCTGLHKGSLYQTFGSKHELFMRALRNYTDRTFAEVASVISESQSPLENIRAVMHLVINQASEESGCMMMNSLAELAPHDPEVKEALQASGQRRLTAMTELVGKAKDAGEIRDARQPGEIALQLMVTLAGSATTMKGFLTREQALETVDNVLRSLT